MGRRDRRLRPGWRVFRRKLRGGWRRLRSDPGRSPHSRLSSYSHGHAARSSRATRPGRCRRRNIMNSPGPLQGSRGGLPCLPDVLDLRVCDMLPQPHASATIRARDARTDQFDARFIKRGNQLHQRIDIAADHTIAGFHALDRGYRKVRQISHLPLIDIQERARSPELMGRDHEYRFSQSNMLTPCEYHLQASIYRDDISSGANIIPQAGRAAGTSTVVPAWPGRWRAIAIVNHCRNPLFSGISAYATPPLIPPANQGKRKSIVTERKRKISYLFLRPDGERVIATERELIFLGHNGAIIRSELNGEVRFVWPSYREQKAIVRNLEQLRRQRMAANGDDALIETYLKHNSITGYFEREARTVWALYKQLTNGKPLKDASRDDGRKLVDYFEKQNLKSASISKKIGWLSAAVNLAINEGKLKFNPFSSIVRARDDKQRRLPLSESDIRTIKRNLDRLDESDRLLVRVLATTGMRLSEAFEIDSEMKEGKCRYIIVGRKTDQSLRRVPLPADLLPFLPKQIEKQLFKPEP